MDIPMAIKRYVSVPELLLSLQKQRPFIRIDWSLNDLNEGNHHV